MLDVLKFEIPSPTETACDVTARSRSLDSNTSNFHFRQEVGHQIHISYTVGIHSHLCSLPISSPLECLLVDQ